MAGNEQKWVLKPDQVNIEIAVGREAKLSPEVRDALDKLMRVLEAEQEVRGYGQCQEVSIGDCDAVFSCKGSHSSPPILRDVAKAMVGRWSTFVTPIPNRPLSRMKERERVVYGRDEFFRYD